MSEKKIFDNDILYCYNNIKSLKNIIFKYIFFLLIFSITIVPSFAIELHGNLTYIPEGSDCADCHNPHQTMDIPSGSSSIKNSNIPSVSKSNSIQSFAATNVIGDITLISSLGQNWFQQGIYGPNKSNDSSWGWTFFDENPASGYITPPENVTQRENISALLLDDGNNSNPISGAIVEANVTYWTYDGESYTNHTITVQLAEDNNRKGFYSGRFDFYGGTTYAHYSMGNCDGCHSSIYGATDTQIGYFPGNYTVSIRAEADGKIKYSNLNFEVTPWGCENCHGSGNQHRASADMDSACYICHGINTISFMSDAGNPHQIPDHRTIQCVECHTNKSLNPQNFKGVSFNLGGIDNNRPVPQYDNVSMQLNSGVHTSLSCTYCHNDLSLPTPSGGYNGENYTVNSRINNFTPSFASLEQFEDYYIINVGSSDPLSISLDWNSAANLGFYMYPPDFNPKNGIKPPYYDGATPTNKPEIYINSAPMEGKWILQVYGYNLKYDGPVGMFGPLWYGVLQPPINYTVNSTHPIQKKELPSTPECNNCHYSGASGGANTTYEIPDWNPGFAHADTSGDGTLDIQCRMCHDSMHNIGIKTCQNCHTTAPAKHPILPDPGFTQYTPTQCLSCHGDPHRITGRTNCIACHSPGDVNISLFGNHSKIYDSNDVGNVTNDDCWTCHYQKDMNRSHVYLCESCHSNEPRIVPITNVSLIMSDFMHDSTECRTCHAPIGIGYHLKGTVGPLGTVEKILRKIQP